MPKRNKTDSEMSIGAAGMHPETSRKSEFQQTLHKAATKGVLHDCLEFNNGLSIGSVMSWKMMEYLPFRRMDLKPDGSWQAISFPLPMGEVRDIPENAHIHFSAIQRMEANENYRYVYPNTLRCFEVGNTPRDYLNRRNLFCDLQIHHR